MSCKPPLAECSSPAAVLLQLAAGCHLQLLLPVLYGAWLLMQPAPPHTVLQPPFPGSPPHFPSAAARDSRLSAAAVAAAGLLG